MTIGMQECNYKASLFQTKIQDVVDSLKQNDEDSDEKLEVRVQKTQAQESNNKYRLLDLKA